MRLFQAGSWQPAAMFFEEILARGKLFPEAAPKLITCLFNTREELLYMDIAKIESLIQQLEQARHTQIAASLRQQLQAKLPRKKGLKFW
jgi:hypothetical protein